MTAENLLERIASRRSIRRFRRDALPEGVIERLIAVAATAPSAHDARPWRFVVVDPGQVRERLAAAMAPRLRAHLQADGLSPERIEQLTGEARQRLIGVPGLVCICLEAQALKPAAHRWRRRIETTMAIQGVAAATTTLLLAAHLEGLGAYWLSAPLFAPAGVRRALDLPATWEPQAFVLVGYPAGPQPRAPQPPAEVSSEGPVD